MAGRRRVRMHKSVRLAALSDHLAELQLQQHPLGRPIPSGSQTTRHVRRRHANICYDVRPGVEKRIPPLKPRSLSVYQPKDCFAKPTKVAHPKSPVQQSRMFGLTISPLNKISEALEPFAHSTKYLKHATPATARAPCVPVERMPLTIASKQELEAIASIDARKMSILRESALFHIQGGGETCMTSLSLTTPECVRQAERGHLLQTRPSSHRPVPDPEMIESRGSIALDADSYHDHGSSTPLIQGIADLCPWSGHTFPEL